MWKLIAGIFQGALKAWTFKERVDGKLDFIIDAQKNLERRVLRLEIISAMRRDDRAIVHQLYDTYKNEYLGNSYMDELYKEYCKKPNKVRSKK